jgi:hypothetical protein
MSQQAQPGVIPYVEYHPGERRLLTLDLTSGNAVVVSRHRPIVGIDGRHYVVVWGPVTFEVPSDRNVHLSVHVEGDFVTQVASMIVAPASANLSFRYETHYTTGVGSLIPQS